MRKKPRVDSTNTANFTDPAGRLRSVSSSSTISATASMSARTAGLRAATSGTAAGAWWWTAWWWWHGSAVDQTNIAHELQRFHDAGLGGVNITSIYGVKGAEAREIKYLTPAWLDMMGYTVDEAKRLGGKGP